MVLKDSEIELIIKVLKEKLNPKLIYIFGSSAFGMMKKESDIDIAFLTKEDISEYQVFSLAQNLAGILGREIDLINLYNASTVLKAQIVGKGKIIFFEDDNERMQYEIIALKEYALLNEEREFIIREVKKRGTIYGE